MFFVIFNNPSGNISLFLSHAYGAQPKLCVVINSVLVASLPEEESRNSHVVLIA